MKKIITNILKILTVSLILTGCYRKIPDNMLFTPSKGGDTFTFEVKVSQEDEPYELGLYTILNEEIATGRRKRTIVDSQKLLSYFRVYDSKGRRTYDLKLDMVLDITFVNKATGEIALHRLVTDAGSDVAGEGRISSLIPYEFFNNGTYIVTVKYVEGDPKYQDLYMYFVFHLAPRGK